MSEIWNPKGWKCSLLSCNDNIFVEAIDEAEYQSDLAYGKIISCPHDDWLDNIDKNNRVILFKKNKNTFGFISSYDNLYHGCYVIKVEDILGQFFNQEKTEE